MENVTLTPKEQMRVQVLNSLLAEQIALDQAAELMGVSTRHALRITTAYREEGAAALAHGHRGRRPVDRRQLVLPAHCPPKSLPNEGGYLQNMPRKIGRSHVGGGLIKTAQRV